MQNPRLETRGPVLWVTLNRPEKRNAFDGRTMEEMIRVLSAPPEGVHVVVLAAEGDVFCAGADLAWMSSHTTREDSMLIARFFRAVRMCPRPVVARVNGPAIGGGVGLVACSDVSVSVERAFFQLSEVRVGIIPAVISPYVAEKVGVGRLREWMLTARRLPARQAEHWGLLTEVAADSALDDAVSRYVDHLLAGSPVAQAAAKELSARLSGVASDALLAHTVDVVTELRAGPDAQERMRAFLNRKTGGRR